MLLQLKNGVQLGSTNKINEIACAKMIDVLAKVVMEFLKKIFEKYGKQVKRELVLGKQLREVIQVMCHAYFC